MEDFWGQEGRKMDSTPEGTLALMAFTLSDLPTDLSRRLMLREMWNTGADTMVCSPLHYCHLKHRPLPDRL